jgi:endonuclease/exonuclease/phosphatase family metal-dependent hydrolase
MLSLISYNIFLGRKIDEIEQWYLNLKKKFEIICFQEFPQDEIDNFMQILPPYYKYEFAKTIKLRAHKKDYGQLTIYNSRKLTLTHTRLIPHGKSIIDRYYSGNTAERSALMTQFTYKDTNFLIINCHLTPLTHNKRRIQEISIITSQIRDTDRAVIVGDYNYPHFRRSGLVRYMEENNFENPTPKLKTYKFFFIKQQYDYLFHKNCTVKNVRILKAKFSDHQPLIATFLPS